MMLYKIICAGKIVIVDADDDIKTFFEGIQIPQISSGKRIVGNVFIQIGKPLKIFNLKIDIQIVYRQ